MIVFKGRHYVYEIVDRQTGDILYVGETANPSRRLNDHVAKRGKFAGRRAEIEMRLHSHYATRKEAIRAEKARKEELQMRTEFDHWKEQGRKGKLSMEAVMQMRAMYETGMYTQQQLGEIFDVTNVSRILTNKVYNYDV